MSKPTVFEFLETQDRSLLARYYALRNHVFRESNSRLPQDFGHEDQFDRRSFFAIALCDGLVAGGGRLTLSPHLPLEDQCFVLEDLDGLRYAEISRMAVDGRFAEGLVLSTGISRKLCQIAGREGVNTVFSICPANSARLNRINSRKCGVEFRLHEQRRSTSYGLDMWLCSFRGIQQAYGSQKEVALCNRF